MPDHFARQCEIFQQLKVVNSQHSGISTYWEHIRIVITHLQKSFRSGTRVFRPLEMNRKKKMKNARAKREKLSFFIVKYANLWDFCCRRRRGCLNSLVDLA